MTPTATPFFVVGGTIPPGAPSYIERAADQVLLESLRTGEFCYVLTPRQMGKSSLMVRTALRLRQVGVAVVRLDLTAVGQNLQPEQWFDGLLAVIGDQLHCEELLDQAWLAQARLGPCQRFLFALRAMLRSLADRRFVLFVDELDTVRSLPFATDEFFAAIRECHNRRAEDPEFRRLTFCLLGVATPADLIHDPKLTPFNIGRRVELHDFTLAEAQGFLAGIPAPSPREAKRILDRVYHWTHGHPYLTQRLCRALVQDLTPANPTGKPTLTRASVDEACEELFLSPSARIQDDNLQLLRERLLNSSLNRARVLNVYRRVLRGWPAVPHDETDATGSVLRLAGVARVERGRLKVRNRIYAKAFDAAWIDASMPDVERMLQRSAHRLGVLRTASVSLLILALLVLLANQARERQRQSEQATRLAITHGLNRMERGDPIEAQRHFIDALERQISDSRDAEISRLRVGAVQALAPKLRHRFTLRSEASAIAISSDLRIAVTGDDSGEIKCWHLDSGVAVGSPVEFPGRITDLQLNSTSEYLAALTDTPEESRLSVLRRNNDGWTRLWSTSGVSAIVWRRNLLIAGFSSGALTAVASDTGQRVWQTHFGSPVSRLAESASGSIAAGLDGGEIHRIDATSGLPLGIPLTPEAAGNFQFLALSADDKSMVALYQTNVAILWRREGSNWKQIPLQHANWPFAAAFSQDGSRLVTGGADCFASVWGTDDGQLRHRFRHTHDVYSVAFSGDDTRVLAASADGAVTLWDGQSGEGPLAVMYHETFALGAVFVGDTKRILSHSRDKTACLWQLPPEFPFLREAFGPGAIHDPSHALAAKAGIVAFQTADSAVELWSWNSKTRVAQILFPSPVVHFALAPDAGRLVAATRSGAVLLSNLRADSSPIRLPPLRASDVGFSETAEVRGLAVSPGIDSTIAVWGSEGEFLLCRDADPASVWRQRLSVTDASGVRACFSSDGRYAAAGHGDGQIEIFEVANRQRLASLSVTEARRLRVTGIAFGPEDSGRLAASFSNGQLDPGGAVLWRWREERGSHRYRWLAHKDGVVQMTQSDDGAYIATASEDSTIGVWSGQTGKLENYPVSVQHQANHATFSRGDGLVLLGLWQAGRIARLFETSTLEPIGNPIVFPTPLRSVHFISDTDWRILAVPRAGQPMLVTLPFADEPVWQLRSNLHTLSPRHHSLEASQRDR